MLTLLRAARELPPRATLALRSHLVLLVIAALLPLLVFTVILVVQHGHAERSAAERGLRETVRAMSVALERTFDSSITTLQAVAASRHLDRRDLPAFHADAGRVLRTQPDWVGIALATPAAEPLLTLPRPLGAPLPETIDPESFVAVVQSGKPAVGNLIQPGGGERPVVPVRVPVFRDGQLTHVLTALVKLETFTRLLSQQHVPPDWVAAVVDRNRMIVARTRAADRFVGGPGTAAFTARTREAEDDFYRDTTVDGQDVYVGFSRGQRSGWTMALGVPVHVVEAPVAQTLVTLFGGGGVLLGLGIVIALVVGRRIAGSIAALAAGARALGEGRLEPIDSGPVKEVELVARAIEAAGEARRRVEQALRASEQELADFFENSAVGLHWLSVDGRILRVNQAELDMLGYTREEYLGRAVGDFHVDGDAARDIVARLSRREPLRSYEAQLRAKDGSVRDVLIDSSVYWNDGRFVHTCCITRDITDRKQAERHLAVLADASRHLAGSLDFDETLQTVARVAVPSLADFCLLDVLTPEGAIARVAAVRADAEARPVPFPEALRHVPPADFVGNPVADALRSAAPVFVPEVTEAWVEAAATTPEHLRFLRTLDVRSIVTVPLAVHERVLGALTCGFAGSGRRHTQEHLRLAQELAHRAAAAVENAQLYGAAQSARHDAEAANRAKDDFLAILSHELRTPLTAILGWVRMLQSGRLGAEQARRALDTIERNTRMQTQLINDLLDVSRIVAAKLMLDTHPLNPAAVVADAVESLRRDAESKGVTLDTALDPAAGPVLGDATRLHQILVNLVSNALKFTPTGGRVEVTLARHDGVARVTVRDSGVGIAREALPHIFDRFRQADSTISRRHEGLGLGLAIVRHLVELHGGTVRAESEGEGRGARFIVDLPVMAVHPAATSADQAARDTGVDAARLEGLVVLLVEDHADSRELIRTVLEQQGAKVTAAGSVAEAVEAFKDAPVDVLVSDLGMPGADGFDLIRWIRARERAQRRRRLPAVALTAFASAEDRDRALAAGFELHAAKPIDPRELTDIVARAARLRRAS